MQTDFANMEFHIAAKFLETNCQPVRTALFWIVNTDTISSAQVRYSLPDIDAYKDRPTF